jgi:hypothetical protein
MNDIDRNVISSSAERIEWVIGQPYSTTVQRLLSILKKPRQVKIAFLSRFKGPTALKEYLHQVAGEPGLMILGTITHGRMLGLLGGPVQTQMFLIGNPPHRAGDDASSFPGGSLRSVASHVLRRWARRDDCNLRSAIEDICTVE